MGVSALGLFLTILGARSQAPHDPTVTCPSSLKTLSSSSLFSFPPRQKSVVGLFDLCLFPCEVRRKRELGNISRGGGGGCLRGSSSLAHLKARGTNAQMMVLKHGLNQPTRVHTHVHTQHHQHPHSTTTTTSSTPPTSSPITPGQLMEPVSTPPSRTAPRSRRGPLSVLLGL